MHTWNKRNAGKNFKKINKIKTKYFSVGFDVLTAVVIFGDISLCSPLKSQMMFQRRYVPPNHWLTLKGLHYTTFYPRRRNSSKYFTY
jgi:hypothetical protein